jgi:energy-coupling factor transporter ATP-binding protein EcfA2
MPRIIIKNIGPISDVNIELNKVNILMGPQSSGKSTIAKIISYCQWVEKRYILDGKYEDDVLEQLLKFHRLGKEYFSEDSFFEYESEFISISCNGSYPDSNPDNDIELNEAIVSKKNDLDYKKSKNIYVPSERNFVATIPNLSKYNETNDNIMSFVYDWYDAKGKFTKSNTLPILDLGVTFYNNEESDSDILILSKNLKEIHLRESSSGLQSLTPLTVIIEYLTNIVYNETRSLSVKERKELDQFIARLTGSEARKDDEILWVGPGINDLIEQRTLYHHTNFIIEEPEQNLFPKTQRDFMYYILNKLQTERDHSLLITTHSPYILYAINNCLMGSLVSGKMPQEEKDKLASKDSWISPELVSIWEIDPVEGKVRSIKDESTGTVSAHYFNKIMNEIMNEYYEMLNYYQV